MWRGRKDAVLLKVIGRKIPQLTGFHHRNFSAYRMVDIESCLRWSCFVIEWGISAGKEEWHGAVAVIFLPPPNLYFVEGGE